MILETLADAFQGEHETELFDALEDTFCGYGRKKGEKHHGYSSTAARPSARILSTTSGEPEHSSPHCHQDTGGQQVVFMKACKRLADEFLRDPKEHDAHKAHKVYVSQLKEARAATEEQEGGTDVETALAALNEDDCTELEEADVQEILVGFLGVTTIA